MAEDQEPTSTTSTADDNAALTENQQAGDVATQIEDIPAADGADVMETLAPEKAADVAEYLDPNTAAAVLSKMDAEQAAEVIEDMETPEASMVLQRMDPDDRVDVLGHIPRKLHDELVGEMDAEQAEETRQLEKYPPDTAGGIMTSQVTSLYQYLTVDNAIQELRRINEELEQMFYVYVIDRGNRLVGVLSMRDLILAKPETRLHDIMIPGVRSVPATQDQEEVARMMKKYKYLAMPVVDERGRLVGLITVDDVVDVLEEEATEDVQRMFGAGAEERLTSPWPFSFKKRVWWLEVNLGTAFLAAAVVGMFEGTIQKVAILAAYMPIVAGMGGNASAQAMAVAIRGIARGEVDRAMLKRVMYREFIVGLLTGIVIGITTGLIAWAFHQDHKQGVMLAVVVGVALVINHAIACVTGVAVPFVMKWLGFDPAQSATIFATTVTDVVGFFALLGLAYMWLV